MAEVAAMRYISDNITIPLPFVLHYDMKEESPGGLGPFIIIEWVENSGDVVDVLNTPGLTYDDPPILNPDIDEEKLERVYSQMADVLLQLSKCEFAAIGSLGFQDEGDDPEAITKPLSLNVARLANSGRVPHFELTNNVDSCFESSPRSLDWPTANSTRGPSSCGAMASGPPTSSWTIPTRWQPRSTGSSRMRPPPSSHPAPRGGCFSRRPRTGRRAWTTGQHNTSGDWLPTFLHALEAKERQLVERGLLEESGVLSARMRRSWESGRFWLTCAARRTWALDGTFFLEVPGRGVLWEERERRLQREAEAAVTGAGWCYGRIREEEAGGEGGVHYSRGV